MNRPLGIALIIALLPLSIAASSKIGSLQATDSKKDYNTPQGFPEMPVPKDNAYTEARWLLGKKLFFDNRLSKNNTISCASCHQPQRAFADSTTLSKGDSGLLFASTNTPSLTNIGYHPYFLRGGSVPTLEMQVLVPIQEHNEFNTSILDILEKLKTDTAYQLLAQNAYQRPLDAFVLTRALANFQRSFISGNSRYDKYLYQGDKKALNKLELKGKQLFFSKKTGCSDCHAGFNFTNYSFENNGLLQEYTDKGRMRFTHKTADLGKFKVPSLRNVALTAPYMHDGSLATLEAVVAHYNKGGQQHPNKSNAIRPLHLNKKEQTALVAFLNTLTDNSFVNNKKFYHE